MKLTTSNLLITISLVLYLSVAGLFLASSRNTEFHNSIHELWSCWPHIDDGRQTHKQFIVPVGEFRDITDRRILIKLGGQNLVFTDEPLEHNLQLDATYFGASDEPTLSAQAENQTLEVKIDRKRREVHLPLGTRPNADYEVVLGNLQIPAHVDLDILAGHADFSFDEAKLISLDVTAESSTVESYIYANSLPSEKLVAQVTNASQTIHLPSLQPLTINYRLETEDDTPQPMKIIIDGLERELEQSGTIDLAGVGETVVIEIKIEKSGKIEIIRDL